MARPIGKFILTPGANTGYVLTSDVNGVGSWAPATGGSGGAPTTDTYIVQVADASLPNAQVLAALGTGLLGNTTGTGTLTNITQIMGGTF